MDANLTRDLNIPESAQTRACSCKAHKVEGQEREFDLSMSSEYAVERSWGDEILSHDEGAVDLSRMAVAPSLLHHDTKQPVGKVLSVRIENGRMLGRVRFGRSKAATEAMQDVEDGVLGGVSIGYRILEVKERKSGKRGPRKEVLVTRWQPYEQSFVSIGADPTVGVGRSIDLDGNRTIPVVSPASVENHSTPASESDPMKTRLLFDKDPAAGGGTITADDIKAAERARVAAINDLAEKHGCRELGQSAIRDGVELDAFKGLVLEKRYNAKPVETRSGPDIGLSEKEVKQYSLVRAMNCMANGRPLDGLEREASDQVAKNCRRDAQGFFIPHDVLTRNYEEMAAMQRTLQATVNASGGFLVNTNLLVGSMVELLRNKMLVAQLGATQMTGLQGNIAIPKVTGGATAYWLDETGQIPTSDQTFGQIGMVPHRLGCVTGYTKQFLAQSSLSVEAFVRADQTKVLALEKDRVAINGTGGAQPKGILAYAASSNNAETDKRAANVTFGAAAAWAKILEFEKNIALANADYGAMAFLTTPSVRAAWKAILKNNVAGAQYLWDNNQVNGYRAESTNQVPNDKVIFGNWADLVLGDWDGIDVVVDPFSQADKGIVRVITTILTDSVLRQPKSFSVSADSGAQ